MAASFAESRAPVFYATLSLSKGVPPPELPSGRSELFGDYIPRSLGRNGNAAETVGMAPRPNRQRAALLLTLCSMIVTALYAVVSIVLRHLDPMALKLTMVSLVGSVIVGAAVLFMLAHQQGDEAPCAQDEHLPGESGFLIR